MPLGGRAIEVRGLKDLARDLKQIDAELPKQLRKAALTVAKLVQAEAQSQAQAATPTQRKAAAAIRASASAAKASIAVRPTSAIPFAFGAFFGAKRFKQFEPWVGSAWKAGADGEGPYAINPAISVLEGAIRTVYTEALDEVTRQAFPN